MEVPRLTVSLVTDPELTSGSSKSGVFVRNAEGWLWSHREGFLLWSSSLDFGRINLATCVDMSIRGIESGFVRVVTAGFTFERKRGRSCRANFWSQWSYLSRKIDPLLWTNFLYLPGIIERKRYFHSRPIFDTTAFFYQLSSWRLISKELHQGTKLRERIIFLLYLFLYLLHRKQDFNFFSILVEGKEYV